MSWIRTTTSAIRPPLIPECNRNVRRNPRIIFQIPRLKGAAGTWTLSTCTIRCRGGSEHLNAVTQAREGHYWVSIFSFKHFETHFRVCRTYAVIDSASDQPTGISVRRRELFDQCIVTSSHTSTAHYVARWCHKRFRVNISGRVRDAQCNPTRQNRYYSQP
jgi:hypothetical protein